MKLRLWVATTEGTDMDLFVGVQKLDVGGDEVHFFAKTGYTGGPVAMGWLRVSERALDEDRSTPWQPVLSHDDPQPLTPDEVVPVDIEILPSSTLFRSGESLQVVVQGSDLFEHPALAHAYSRDVNRACMRSTREANTTRTCSSRSSHVEPADQHALPPEWRRTRSRGRAIGLGPGLRTSRIGSEASAEWVTWSS